MTTEKRKSHFKILWVLLVLTGLLPVGLWKLGDFVSDSSFYDGLAVSALISLICFGAALFAVTLIHVAKNRGIAKAVVLAFVSVLIYGIVFLLGYALAHFGAGGEPEPSGSYHEENLP